MNSFPFARVLLGFASCASVACGPREASPPADSLTTASDSVNETPTSTAQPTAYDTSFVVTEKGLGVIRIGMTRSELSAALGTEVKESANRERESCDQVNVAVRSKKVLLMLIDERLARLDIVAPGISTRAGAQVGDDEARINTLYAGLVQTTPHKYTEGHYLTVTPSVPADSGFRLVFETDGKNVTRYRTGRLPEVEWVEGCS